jgi:hypothetical protein
MKKRKSMKRKRAEWARRQREYMNPTPWTVTVDDISEGFKAYMRPKIEKILKQMVDRGEIVYGGTPEKEVSE